MESVHKIVQDLPSVLTDKNKKKLAKIMQKLGFDDLVPLFCEMPLDREKKVNIPSIPYQIFNRSMRILFCLMFLNPLTPGSNF